MKSPEIPVVRMSLSLPIALNLELHCHITVATTQMLATRSYQQEDIFIVKHFFPKIILGWQCGKIT